MVTNDLENEALLGAFACHVVERTIWTDTLWSVGARSIFLFLPAILPTVALLISIGILGFPVVPLWVVVLCPVGLYLWWDFWGLIRKEQPILRMKREIAEVDGEKRVVGAAATQIEYRLNRIDLAIWRMGGLTSVGMTLSAIGVTLYVVIS